jgi:asparagine synthase (glutamine-hydrolysing)
MAAIFGEWSPRQTGSEQTWACLDRMQVALRRRLPTARSSGSRGASADQAPILCGATIGRRGGWTVVVEGVLRWTAEQTARFEREDTDSERVARWLDELGPVAALGSLRGAFAIAAYDHARGELWLVRDATGQRVLYFARAEANGFGARPFAFASETKALLARGDVSRELDRRSVVRYLVFSFVPGEPTLLSAVREVPPGTALVFSADGRERARHRLYFPTEPADIQARDEEARSDPTVLARYAQALRRTLEEVLAASLAATADRGPPAAFLSGGVDSSLVVALAASQGHKTPCYSISFGPSVPNELVFSKLVADHVGVPHHVIEVTPAMMTESLPETVYLLDDPIGDPLTVPNHVLALTAKAQGFRRVLNGEGGDPCFGGPKNIPMMLAEWYDPLEGARERAYLRSYQKLYDDLPRLLCPALSPLIDDAADPLWAPIAPLLNNDEGAGAQRSFLNKLQAVNLVFKGGNSILVKVEKLAGAADLTALSLLFEQEVAERAWQAPPSLKLSGNVEKVVLKAAVADLLPQAIIDRKKSGMLVPVHPWFQGELKGYAAEAFSRRTVLKRGLFEPAAIDEMVRYRGAVTTRGFYGAKLWLLLTLEIWMRLFLDGDGRYFEQGEASWAPPEERP